MPYITTEQVKEKREILKKEFPNVKFSVTRDGGCLINVHIMEAKFDIIGHESINTFRINEHYAHDPQLRDFLLRVKSIIDAGNRIISVDGDYGEIPKFYIDISFGKWDKPYKKMN